MESCKGDKNCKLNWSWLKNGGKMVRCDGGIHMPPSLAWGSSPLLVRFRKISSADTEALCCSALGAVLGLVAASSFFVASNSFCFATICLNLVLIQIPSSVALCLATIVLNWSRAHCCCSS